MTVDHGVAVRQVLRDKFSPLQRPPLSFLQNTVVNIVYILYSPSLDLYYVGETEDIEVRQTQHNVHTFRGAFTSRAADWELKATLECRDRVHARLVEAHIKRQKRRAFIERLISEEELRSWLISKF
ncbi:MAG TPA: GIY-YIG nuclease family protein [Flavobacteriales bacterium]|nr:GIY-YIG nuclease family protein [Flavobacteriales bacterium]